MGKNAQIAHRILILLNYYFFQTTSNQDNGMKYLYKDGIRTLYTEIQIGRKTQQNIIWCILKNLIHTQYT